MKYVVNTVWKHPNDIDWDRMKEGLEQLRDDEGCLLYTSPSPRD